MQNFVILASVCSWAGWFEYDLVESPKDWFSCDEAQMISTMKGWYPIFTRINLLALELLLIYLKQAIIMQKLYWLFSSS